VTVRPTAVIKNYKGLTACKEEVSITEADLDAELKPFIDRATRIMTVDRPAREGDIAVIDYEGFDNGVPFEGGKGEKYELKLGSDSFIPGFEQQVAGMSAGEEKELHVSFPAEYHAKELAGKPVVFKVRLHEVKESIAPVLDDEFAKDVSEFDTLDELKKDLADKLMKRRQAQADRAFEESLVEQLIGLMEVEIPEPMVEYQADKMLDDYAARISSRGIPFEQYLQMTGMTRQDLRAQAMPDALRQIQGRLALDAVAAAEAIEVSDEEVEQELSKLAEQYGMELEQVKGLVPVQDMRGDLLRQKAMKVVSESAKVELKAPGGKKPGSRTERHRKHPQKTEIQTQSERRRAGGITFHYQGILCAVCLPESQHPPQGKRRRVML
jgi:trigger factor